MILGLGKNVDNIGEGLLYALICILVVFAVLIIIYLVISLLNKIKGLDENAVEEKAPVNEKTAIGEIDDEDMMVAALIASIDYQNEVKTDVKLVKIKQL